MDFEANFELKPLTIDAEFTIDAQVYKTSQLINDSDFQNAEQVQEAIEESSLNIDGSELIDVIHDEEGLKVFSKSFVFEQGIASKTWVIKHDLNKRPSVVAVDSGGKVHLPDEVTYDNNNQVTIGFVGSFAGKAYLN